MVLERPSDDTVGGADDSKLVYIAALLTLGLALQMLLWSRQWIYGDQYALLTPALESLAAVASPPSARV